MRLAVIQIAIKIGDITPLRAENWLIVPDDRQSLVETIGGVEVQDFGRVEDGDKFSCAVTLAGGDASTLFDYWHNRTRVTVIDEGAQNFENMRVVVKEYTRLTPFTSYFSAKLEFWRK